MSSYVYVVVVTILICLSGVGAFALLWPRDTTRHRPFRSWPLTLLILGVAAPAIIAVPIFTADFLTDNGHNWLRWGFYAACATSLALVVAALVGDRSRGRRRCPRCWYDMGATPGLKCPECGYAARSERALFRSRRRRVLLLAAFVPATAALLPWNALYYRGPDWAKNLSNTAFVLACPFMHRHSTFVQEIERSLPLNSSEPRQFSAWQRAVLVRFARRGQTDPVNVRHALTASRTLVAYQADDRATVDALVSLITSSNMYAPKAIETLGQVQGDAPAAKAALLDVLNSGDPGLSYLGAAALAYVTPRAPGGPPPKVLLNNGQIGAAYSRVLTIRLLRWFDPTEETRIELTGALDDRQARSAAVVALAGLWPQNGEYRAMLLDAVRYSPDNARPESPGVGAVYTLLFDELSTRDRLGGFDPARAVLYTPELCAELEKWLPLIESNDAQYGRVPERAFGRLLRQTLGDARALRTTEQSK